MVVKAHSNKREIEPGIVTDLAGRETYGSYLQLDQLLGAQRPLSDPPHHDEMMFIIQHQVAELWFKLLLHEVDAAMTDLRNGELGHSIKILGRIKTVQAQLINQWDVLATLTPSEYAEFREVLGKASGLQSPQYRIFEFKLGNKNRDMMPMFRHHLQQYRWLRQSLESPSIYDEFLRHLYRLGHRVPLERVERDWTEPYEAHPQVVEVFKVIYEHPDQHWAAYEVSEKLVDIEINFQAWRFKHMKTVERIIGFKTGTGGSSGVGFLKKALDVAFFPELFQVRTAVGSG